MCRVVCISKVIGAVSDWKKQQEVRLFFVCTKKRSYKHTEKTASRLKIYLFIKYNQIFLSKKFFFSNFFFTSDDDQTSRHINTTALYHDSTLIITDTTTLRWRL
jgi:hypothetical protein